MRSWWWLEDGLILCAVNEGLGFAGKREMEHLVERARASGNDLTLPLRRSMLGVRCSTFKDPLTSPLRIGRSGEEGIC